MWVLTAYQYSSVKRHNWLPLYWTVLPPIGITQNPCFFALSQTHAPIYAMMVVENADYHPFRAAVVNRPHRWLGPSELWTVSLCRKISILSSELNRVRWLENINLSLQQPFAPVRRASHELCWKICYQLPTRTRTIPHVQCKAVKKEVSTGGGFLTLFTLAD